MKWLFKSRSIRRPIAILGATCTSVLVGFALINKVMFNIPAQCLASCASAQFTSYQILQKNEASRRVKHSRVKGFDVNFLGSNSPIEDRFVVGASENIGTAFFSVIDGHKGAHCSHYLQNHMLQHISTALHSAGNVKDDLRILLDMNNTFHHQQSNSESQISKVLSAEVIKDCLGKSFSSLDKYISDVALEDVKLIRQGHSFNDDIRNRVLTAIEGACAITAVVQETDVVVASTGDCRVVIGQEMPDHSWRAVPLSKDQNAQNEDEVKRLQAAHPGEEGTVIFGNRVLGSLMPFRTFGDVDFKWEKKHLDGLVQVWPNYQTPPYITAEPVVTKYKIEKGDRFMILGSDGLWERITNEEAINVVAESLKMKNVSPKQSLLSSLFGSKSSKGTEEECCLENAATKLLWHILGGSEAKVTELLNVDPKLRRMYRDDITIIVVYFDES